MSYNTENLRYKMLSYWAAIDNFIQVSIISAHYAF
jgi:hypothetical protein